MCPPSVQGMVSSSSGWSGEHDTQRVKKLSIIIAFIVFFGRKDNENGRNTKGETKYSASPLPYLVLQEFISMRPATP
jgi:hypothetical protein